jgi:hypothetical protein
MPGRVSAAYESLICAIVDAERRVCERLLYLLPGVLEIPEQSLKATLIMSLARTSNPIDFPVYHEYLGEMLGVEVVTTSDEYVCTHSFDEVMARVKMENVLLPDSFLVIQSPWLKLVPYQDVLDNPLGSALPPAFATYAEFSSDGKMVFAFINQRLNVNALTPGWYSLPVPPVSGKKRELEEDDAGPSDKRPKLLNAQSPL